MSGISEANTASLRNGAGKQQTEYNHSIISNKLEDSVKAPGRPP